jgi:hypothetical protein
MAKLEFGKEVVSARMQLIILKSFFSMDIRDIRKSTFLPSKAGCPGRPVLLGT